MECERKSHGGDEPQVGPRRHGDERLILRQAVKRDANFIVTATVIFYAKYKSHLFMAFNISMVTSTERAIVMG